MSDVDADLGGPPTRILQINFKVRMHLSTMSLEAYGVPHARLLNNHV